jgi:hypothetical protein
MLLLDHYYKSRVPSLYIFPAGDRALWKRPIIENTARQYNKFDLVNLMCSCFNNYILGDCDIFVVVLKTNQLLYMLLFTRLHSSNMQSLIRDI